MTEDSNRLSRATNALKPSAGIAAAVTVIGGTLVIGGQPVAAANFTVTNVNDSGSGSLRDAIIYANGTAGPDTITFAPGLSGTIALAGHLGVTDDLTIVGPGEGQLTLTSTTDDVLYLYNAASLDLSNLTIDGTGGEGIRAYLSGDLIVSAVSIANALSDGIAFYSPGSDLTIESSTISGSADNAVYIRDAADVTMADSSISLNLYNGLNVVGVVTGSLTVTNTQLNGNGGDGLRAQELVAGLTLGSSSTSDNGGRGIALDFYTTGSIAITDSTVSGNSSNGLYANSYIGGDLTIARSTFDANGAHGVYAYRVDGNLMVDDTTMSNNEFVGVYVSNDVGADVSITDSTFDSNTYGVWIDGVVGGDVTVSRSNFVNSPDGDGLVFDTNIVGNTVIEDSTFADNGNAPTGPAFLVDFGLDVAAADGSVLVSGSTFSGNTAAATFGVVNGGVDIVNSTFTGNGDAAVIETGSLTSLRHSTISGNTPTVAAITTAEESVTLDHMIATDNGAVPFFEATGAGSATSSFSILPTGSTLGAGDVESDAPLLGSLGNHGGLTETLVPQAGSPAIDAGDPAIVDAPATDQRGRTRQIGTIDIGAVEVDAGSVSVADATVAEGAGSATVTVTRSGGSGGAASVRVVTTSGTAVAGVDFTAVDQVVSWAAGEAGAKTVSVPITDDTEVESAETFVATLSAAGVSIVDGSATVTITDNDGTAPVDAGAFTSLAPSRFVDTRPSGSTFDDRFEAEGKRARGSEYRVQIAGRGGVPVGARAVVVNVTAVAPEAKGFVTVHPCVSPLPLASSLNYTVGVNLANEIVAPLSASGELCIFTSEAAHIVVDVVGFVDASSPTKPLTPARFLDTRVAGATFDQVSQREGRTGAGGQVTLKVAGRGGVPADAVAVIANVTAVNPDGKGFVTVHPCAPTPPNASSLNYVNGVNRANELIASVNAAGEICLFTSTATDLVVDVVGYVPAGTSFNASAPSRFLDTRASGATVDGVAQAGGKRGAGSQLELQVAGRPGVPLGASAVVVNVTAVAPEATGFVTVHPCEATRPLASSLNYVAGVDGANELIARLDANGRICLFTDQSTHLIVDVVGYLD